MSINAIACKNSAPASSTLGKVVRKLTRPDELRSFLAYKFRYGNEYVYSDLVDRVPAAGRMVQSLLPTRVELDRPIFLAGLRRSGTTLFYRIMHAHPDLFLYNERVPGDRMNRRRAAASARNWNNIWTVASPDAFRSTLHRYIGPSVRLGYRRWGVKLAMEVADPNSGSPSAQDLRHLMRCLPGARVIAIVRDPRDFVLSAIRRAGRNADWWIDDYNIMVRLFCELRIHYPERFMVVRYEDLLTRSREVVVNCCRFGGLEFDPHMLRPEFWSSKGPRAYSRDGIVTKIAKWRGAVGVERLIVEQVERSCFPAATVLGYAPEASRVPATITESLETLAALDDLVRASWDRLPDRAQPPIQS